MILTFKVNKYFLMWNLLYQASISEEVHGLKQKLWIENKKDYSNLYKERDEILNKKDDYIPNDDTIFNLIEDDINYKKVKAETNRYRILLLETWDQNRKKYLKQLNNILKYEFNLKYDVLVVHPNLDMIDIDIDNKILIIGKKLSIRDKDNFITYIIYRLLREKFNKLPSDDKDTIEAILELAITNELYTCMSEESKYNLGKKALQDIKHKIYPYWLMYLGIENDKLTDYMIRDNIFFDVNSYEYDEVLQDLDIFEFISFCINHKKQIMNVKLNTIEDIEII